MFPYVANYTRNLATMYSRVEVSYMGHAIFHDIETCDFVCHREPVIIVYFKSVISMPLEAFVAGIQVYSRV